MSHALRENIPIQILIKEIHCIFALPNPTTDVCIMLHEDNLSAIAMAESLKFTPCTKHIAVKYHHFCSRVNTSFNKSGDSKIKYISTKKQLADIFIKPLDGDNFFALCKMLCGWWQLITLRLRGSVRIQASSSKSGFHLWFLNSCN
jgi:hypothetical protein